MFFQSPVLLNKVPGKLNAMTMMKIMIIIFIQGAIATGQQKWTELVLWLKKIGGINLNVWSIIQLNDKSTLLSAEHPLYKVLTIRD